MAGGCVYECAHPLWGSDGVCTTNDDGEAVCACSPGYASKDILGNPSCVPARTMWALYVGSAALRAAMTMFLVWHIATYVYAPAAVRRTRKATLRLRILVAACVATIGLSAVFSVLASLGGYLNPWDTYMLSTTYTFTVPVLMLQYPLLVEYWLHTLPSQLLPPNSFSSRLKERALKKKLFPRASLVLAIILFSCGIFTYFRSMLALQVADVVTVFGSNLPGIAMGVVASQITAYINRAKLASKDDDGFYGKAKRNIWAQLTVFYLTAAVNTISVIMLHFVHAGRRTPIVPMCIHEMRVESSGSSQDGDAKTAGAGLVFKTNARPDGSHSSALVMVAAPRGKSERAVVIPIDYVDL